MITETRDLDEIRTSMIGRAACTKISVRGITGRISAGEPAVIRDVDFYYDEVHVWISPADDRSVCVILRPHLIKVD